MLLGKSVCWSQCSPPVLAVKQVLRLECEAWSNMSYGREKWEQISQTFNIVNHCENKGRWGSPVLHDRRSVTQNTFAVCAEIKILNLYPLSIFAKNHQLKDQWSRQKPISVLYAWRLRTSSVLKRLYHFKRRIGVSIHKVYIGTPVFRTSP